MPPWYLAAERETVKYSYKTVIIHEHWNREDITNNSYIMKVMKKVFLHILQMPQNNETELYWIQSEEARNITILDDTYKIKEIKTAVYRIISWSERPNVRLIQNMPLRSNKSGIVHINI